MNTNSPDKQSLTPADRDAVARLTEKERECLRRWLNHETAKHIALSLGVSHHAVEKRLKTARAKLSVSSSLEAAQLLDRVESYGRAASQPSDLPSLDETREERSSYSPFVGASIMTVVIALLAGMAFQSGLVVNKTADATEPVLDSAPINDASNPAGSDRKALMLSSDRIEFKPASEAEIREWLGWIFRTTDKDESGFIEAREAPQTYPRDDALGQIVLTGESAQSAFVEDHDENSDSRISEAEFIEASIAAFVEKGIPLLPQSFRPVE